MGRARFECCANCWCLGEHESAALWKIYAGDTGGIAITAQYERLANALPDSVFISKVSYTDTKNATTNINYNPVLFKRPAFSFEQEVRAIIESPLPDAAKGKPFLEQIQFYPKYARQRVSIEKFVDAIIVNPLAPPWYQSVVHDLCKKLGFGHLLRLSELSAAPTHIADIDENGQHIIDDWLSGPAPQQGDGELAIEDLLLLMQK